MTILKMRSTKRAGNSNCNWYLRLVPTPLAYTILYIGFDIVACVGGFAVWALCSLSGVVALLALAAAGGAVQVRGKAM